MFLLHKSQLVTLNTFSYFRNYEMQEHVRISVHCKYKTSTNCNDCVVASLRLGDAPKRFLYILAHKIKRNTDVEIDSCQ